MVNVDYYLGPGNFDEAAATVAEHLANGPAWSTDIAREHLGPYGYGVMSTLLAHPEVLARHGIQADLMSSGMHLLQAVEPVVTVDEGTERRNQLIAELRAGIDQAELASQEQKRESYRRKVLKHAGDGRGLGGWSQ